MTPARLILLQPTIRKDSGLMNPSVRSMNINSADFLQTSLSENRFTITEPIRTPTKNNKLNS